MKAKDLMQFDWVLFGKKKLRCKGISSHTNDVFLEDGTLTNVMNLSPIPLTERILRKNFPEPGEVAWRPSIVTINDEHLIFHCVMGGDLIGIEGEFSYVHQLQHALRLCGIEKEIVL